ncbi:hydrolase TatD, partial [Actinosynnema sp. NPDC059335]
VLWRNPVAFYGQSGRLMLDEPDAPPTFEGNSILRGTPSGAGGA